MDSGYRNAQGRVSADFTAVAVTYAQVAAHPALHRQRTLNRRTLVIFDEIHHAGDALSWGEAAREAFEPAKRRMGLTGTPFRSDANPIPFVTYTADPDGTRRSSSDYVYGYGPALDDGVVRPVIFLAYSGEMRWRTRAGDEITGHPGHPDDRRPARPGVADRAGPGGRVGGPGARGRGPAAHRGAPGHAGRGRPGDRQRPRGRPRLRGAAAPGDRGPPGGRALRRPLGQPEDRRVRRVRATGGWSRSAWSPRGWTSRGWPWGCSRPASAPRCSSRRRSGGSSGPGGAARRPRCSCPRSRSCSATPRSWRPSATTCCTCAGDDDPERELAEAQRQRDTADELGEAPFTALGASAHFDRVLYDGGEFGASAEEEDFLGLPGLLEPEQVALLLRKRQADQLKKTRPPEPERPARPGRRSGAPPAGSAPRAGAPARRAGPVRPRDAGGPAQGAERPHRGLASPHRPAARGDPRGPAPGLRRAAAARGHRRSRSGPASRCSAAGRPPAAEPLGRSSGR